MDRIRHPGLSTVSKIDQQRYLSSLHSKKSIEISKILAHCLNALDDVSFCFKCKTNTFKAILPVAGKHFERLMYGLYYKLPEQASESIYQINTAIWTKKKTIIFSGAEWNEPLGKRRWRPKQSAFFHTSTFLKFSNIVHWKKIPKRIMSRQVAMKSINIAIHKHCSCLKFARLVTAARNFSKIRNFAIRIRLSLTCSHL